MPIKVIIADDHEVVREGLRAAFSAHDLEVVGEAETADDLLAMAKRTTADVILLDVRLGASDGIIALHRLKIDHPDLPVLMFSAFENPTYIAGAVMYRAAGYLLKGSPLTDLVSAIHAVAKGEDIWSRDELRRVTGALATPRLNANVEVPLTHRESEVLTQLAMGLTNKQIGQVLNISYETVKEHVQHILKKIGVTDRTQAAVWAVRNELV